jgi:hypothetical protein
MPLAAIEAGAEDLVVPLEDLGRVISELLAGTPSPKARSELLAIERAFGDRGAVARLAREIEWAATPLGPVLAWASELKTLLRTVMDSPSAMAVWWGPELISERFCLRARPRAGRVVGASGSLRQPPRRGSVPFVGPLVAQVLVQSDHLL